MVVSYTLNRCFSSLLALRSKYVINHQGITSSRRCKFYLQPWLHWPICCSWSKPRSQDISWWRPALLRVELESWCLSSTPEFKRESRTNLFFMASTRTRFVFIGQLTRSSKERVAFRAPSGLPNGKQDLSRKQKKWTSVPPRCWIFNFGTENWLFGIPNEPWDVLWCLETCLSLHAWQCRHHLVCNSRYGYDSS